VGLAHPADRDEQGHQAGTGGTLRRGGAGLQPDGSRSGKSGDISAAPEGLARGQRQGKDTMPNFVMLRLPNDHTAGTRPGGPTPKSSWPTTTWPWAARLRPSPTRRFGTRQRSSFWKTTRRTAAITWTRIAAWRWWSANTRRTGLWRAFCRQPLLLDRKRGAHHGDAARAAAHEQQRCALLADLDAVHRPRRSACLCRPTTPTATTN
jgi:hypothetical protein